MTTKLNAARWASALVGCTLAMTARAQGAGSGPFYGRSLYWFTGGSDGGEPMAGLVQGSDGDLYGTTSQSRGGYGTVFKIPPGAPQSVTTLYTFSGLDGSTPLAGLARGSDGRLYGTASAGGSGDGTLFRISPVAPSYTVELLWTFTGGSDGAQPQAPLFQASDGNFYGTTFLGASGHGTVFRINPLSPGFLTTLWTFTGGSDGGQPTAGLMQASDGNLYGTTSQGGNGYGTVFQINPAGSNNLVTIWTFSGGNDGGQPTAGLVEAADGNLYGTTTEGGETALNPAGTVFRVGLTAPYNLTTLWSFDQSGVGGNGGGLVRGGDGNLYGLLDVAFNDYGGVYQLDPTAPINQDLTVIWSFTEEGWRPFGALAQASDGNFYCTTGDSFAAGGDAGTVFQLLPPSPATQLQILLPGETATPGVAPGKTGIPIPQVAGVPFPVTINAVDANFNPVTTGWRDTSLTSSDPRALLPSDAPVLGGTGTVSVKLDTPGSQTLTASATTQGWGSAPVLSPVTDQVVVNSPGLKLFVSNYGAGSISQITYVPGTGAWAVSAYATDGAPEPPGLGAPLNGPAGLAFDAFGNLVAANLVTNLMAQVTAGGQLGDWPVLAYGGYTNYGLYYGRVGLTFDAKGNLFVANLDEDQDAGNPGFPDSANTISEFQPVPPPPAVPTTYTVSTIASGLTGARGLAFDSHGNLYAADFEANAIRVLTYNAAGSSWGVSTLNFSGPALDGPYGLAFDAAGNLYVANFNGNTISKVTFGAGGTATASIFAANGSGSPNSPLNQPAGLAFDGYGNLYVANLGDSTLAEVSADGACSTLVAGGLDQPAFVVPVTPPANLPVPNIVWTNTAGGNWSNPTNWSPNRVPGVLDSSASSDDAAIAAAGTYTVVLDEGAAPDYWGVHTLALGAGLGGQGVQTLAVSNRTLTTSAFAVVEGGQLISSGSAYTNNPLTVVANGAIASTNDTFHLGVAVGRGGQFTANYLTIAGDCWLTVTGAVNVVGGTWLNLYGPATNSGLINVAEGGISVVNEGESYYQGGLWNLPGGVIALSWPNGIEGQGCGCQVVNQGVILGTNSEISVATFNNQAGTVINGSGILSIYLTYGPLAGTYYAAGGASIYFDQQSLNCPGATAPLVPGTPLVLAGAGQYQFRSGFLYLPSDVVPNLVLSGGTLTLGPDFQGGAITNLELDGIELTNRLVVTGTLTATNSTIDGAVAVAESGQFTANEATIAGDCWLSVTGTVNVVGGTWLNLDGPGTNSGLINLADGGISVVNEGVSYYQGGLWNLPGGVIELSWPNGIEGQGCGCQVVNQGVILGTNSEISVATFNNQAGTVINGSGILSIYLTYGPLAGTYYAAGGASIYFDQQSLNCPGATAPLVPGTPLVLAGAGQYQFRSGFLYLPSDVVPNLVLSGGTLALGPGFQGGTIADLALDGIELTNGLVVTGTLTATNSTIDGGVAVAKGGLFTANEATIASDCWLSVTGTVNVVGGTYLTLYGPATNSGVIDVANGGISLVNYGVGNPSYKGSLLNLAGGTILLARGEGIQGEGSASSEFVNLGAVMGTNSAINVALFTNFGTLTAESGLLALNAVTLEPSGWLTAELNSETDYGQFSISGNAALTGTLGLELTGGFTPNIGDEFLVLSYGSYSGGFTNYDVPSSPCWSGSPGASGLTVTVVSCTDPKRWLFERLPGLSRVGGAAAVFWPSDSGTLEQSPSLGADANWTPVSGFVTENGTNFLNLLPTTGSLFFRLSSP